MTPSDGRRLRRPEEGWLTLGLVLLIVLILAWAVDDPGWVNGKPGLTDGLAWCAADMRHYWHRGMRWMGRPWYWGYHRRPCCCLFFTLPVLLIPILAGWAFAPGAPVAEAFHRTAEGTVNAYLDIAWLGRQFTQQEIHYVLVLGALVWGTAQFAAYAVFGHRRPLNAVVMVGIVLLVNMGLTSRDQLPYLVEFTGASLFLPFEPLLASQILLVNLLADFPAICRQMYCIDLPHLIKLTSGPCSASSISSSA